jgi:RNA polymerase sigma-70 factor, ECF subfamily
LAKKDYYRRDMIFDSEISQKEAFDLFLNSHNTYSRLFNSALRLCGNADDAHDILQEVLTKASRSPKLPEDDPGKRRYIFRSISNEWIDEYRRRQRAEITLVPLEDHQNTSESLFQEEGPPITLEDLEEALCRVNPEEFRTAVLLCDFEQLSYQEVADATNVPIGTVRSRVNRGRIQLRNYLRPLLSAS